MAKEAFPKLSRRLGSSIKTVSEDKGTDMELSKRDYVQKLSDQIKLKTNQSVTAEKNNDSEHYNKLSKEIESLKEKINKIK